MSVINLSVFGDNILECERMNELIQKAFPELVSSQYDIEHIYAPIKILSNNEDFLNIQLFPDYKSDDRWGDKSILTLLSENGATLSEAPDAVLTRSINNVETILLAIEFSSAIPAGNQAWQRSGRALSFSEVNIPYLYITDIGLEELDSERQSKAIRASNPLVPLSYIKHSQRSDTFAYMVLNPSYLLKESPETQKFIVEDEVVRIIRQLILDEDTSDTEELLKEKISNYLDTYNDTSPETVDFSKWVNLDDADIELFIKSFKLGRYNKKIAQKTPIKEEMRCLIKDIIPDYALSIYNSLPVCMIPGDCRIDLSNQIKEKCYGGLSSDIYSWIESEKRPLVICFVNGFKPRGDDARPDRGLVPMVRMLFGDEIDIMSLVFGQATKNTQYAYSSDPVCLAAKNGLWKSVLYYSSLTISDSIHWSLNDSNLSQFRLKFSGPKLGNSITFETPCLIPKKFKENDIDTAIHLTFSTCKGVFESLCNPPGGDWSGISLLDKNGIEYRWMSLPRVSKDTKRPDHIFQLEYNNKTYLLIIESKEKLSGLLSDKQNLGTALIDYVKDLTKYNSSAFLDSGVWTKNTNTDFELEIEEYLTLAAFFSKGEEDFRTAKENLKVDLIIGMDSNTGSLVFKPVNQSGDVLMKILTDKCII
jgi:hypothetical protein